MAYIHAVGILRILLATQQTQGPFLKMGKGPQDSMFHLI